MRLVDLLCARQPTERGWAQIIIYLNPIPAHPPNLLGGRQAFTYSMSVILKPPQFLRPAAPDRRAAIGSTADIELFYNCAMPSGSRYIQKESLSVQMVLQNSHSATIFFLFRLVLKDIYYDFKKISDSLRQVVWVSLFGPFSPRFGYQGIPFIDGDTKPIGVLFMSASD